MICERAREFLVIAAQKGHGVNFAVRIAQKALEFAEEGDDIDEVLTARQTFLDLVEESHRRNWDDGA